jgi:hypothetical protein
MLAHRLYDREGNYNGPLGAATKENLYDITAHPLDQRIFPMDHGFHEAFQDGATSWITQAGRGFRWERDMNMDVKNPREELTKDKPGLLAMDVIPNQIDQKIDMSHPADYEASNAVRLFQQSEMNGMYQEKMFTDPKALENPNSEKLSELSGSNGLKGTSQQELYSMEGSAAGKSSNHLYLDEDGTFLNSVENLVAF